MERNKGRDYLALNSFQKCEGGKGAVHFPSDASEGMWGFALERLESASLENSSVQQIRKQSGKKPQKQLGKGNTTSTRL